MHRTSETDVDILFLKATLNAQQNLLQKLHDELEAEREASASAACEALSVILRLQGEKAAVKMEADQYKRLSEEKMLHVEESLAITEDIICQKETEISALDSQVCAYRKKLSRMGCCIDIGLERRFSDPTDYCFEYMDCIDTYAEQIRKLDVWVKEISKSNNVCNENSLRNRDGFDHPCSPSVHDVFEVPQIHRKLSFCESEVEEEGENGVATKDVENKLYGRDFVEKVLKSKELCCDDNIECRLAVIEPTTSNVSESRNGKEVERITEFTNREEEFKLLNEIKERLSYLHEEVKGLKVKKSSKKDDSSLRTLSEAMLYFWI